LKAERREREQRERQKWTDAVEWNDVLHKQTVTKAISEIEEMISKFDINQYKVDENGYRGEYNQWVSKITINKIITITITIKNNTM